MRYEIGIELGHAIRFRRVAVCDNHDKLALGFHWVWDWEKNAQVICGNQHT